MLKQSLKESYQTHQRWLDVINIIRLLDELCYELRAHRGSSTAQLIGDSIFKSFTEKKSERISTLLVNIDPFHDDIQTLGLSKNFSAITHQWLKIQRQWQWQSALNNFNQHCDMLDNINKVIWKLAISADPSLKDRGDNDKTQLAHFLLKPHTHTLESIARLRGVSSYLCAKDYLTEEDRHLISIEIKRTFNHWNYRFEAFQLLPLRFQRLLEKNIGNNTLTHYLIELIDRISTIQNPDKALPNSSEIFNSANHIIDALQNQYSEGLDHLSKFLPQELDAWVSGSLSNNAQIISSRSAQHA